MRKAANSLVAHFRLLPGNNGRRTGSLPTRASNAADILLQPSSAPSASSNALGARSEAMVSSGVTRRKRGSDHSGVSSASSATLP